MNYFYHNSTKNYTIALIDLFNDISVPRFDNTGKRISDTKVPIKFGNRNIAFMLSDYDIENINNGNVNVLPRMALEFNGLNKALNRNTNKNSIVNRTSKDNLSKEDITRLFHKNSVAYDFEFTLHIATKTFSDATIIIEQIAPLFRPDYTLKINELDIQEEPTSIQVQLGDFDIELPEPNDDEIYLVEISVPITVKGNLYLPIKEAHIIKEVEIYTTAVTTEINYKSEVYEIEELSGFINSKQVDEDDYNIDNAKTTITHPNE